MLRGPLLVLALIVLASAAVPPVDAAAPVADMVTIAPSSGGAPRTVTLGDLAGRFDVHGVTYTVRAADGATSTVTVTDGISLNALLAAVALDGDAFDYISLAKADGSSAIVMRDDLGGTDEGPPVVWGDDQGLHFLRPSGGDGDANGADLVTLADGAPLALALKRGSPLVPRIAISTLRARPGERVRFSASLSGGASLGPGLAYSWYFDGFGSARGAHVSRRFPPGGPYLVLLNVVRGDGTSVGPSDTVSIRVVRRGKRPPDEARRAAASQGGARDGGAGSGTGAGYGGAAGAGASAPSPSTGALSAAAPRPTPAHSDVPAPRRTPPGKLVSGTLLASAGAAAAPIGARPAAVAAARGAAAKGPLHVPVGVWVAIGLVVLLALGWALESRHTLPFWQS
ncbi:MAG: PKD domain-containing protein [Conexibacter sp.]